MLKKIIAVVTILTLIGVTGFGMYVKKEYTDLSNEDGYLDKLYVAELTYDLASEECDLLKNELPLSNLIIRVKVTGDLEHLFKADRQKAEICEIYKGEDLKIGEEIYLISDNWSLVTTYEPMSLQRGFVNILNTGSEYLVFCDRIVIEAPEKIPVAMICEDYFFTPVFSYDDHTNIIVPVSEDSTYVSYEFVRDNEFFAASQEALECMLELKSELLSLYPR